MKNSDSKQQYDGNNVSNVCFCGYAEDVAASTSISKNIKFNLVTAYVHLNMSNIPTNGEEEDLKSVDLSNVNGGFKWVCDKENSVVSTEYCFENKGISVTCTDAKITGAGNAVVRFAVPASPATTEARKILVNKVYLNSNYKKDERKAAAYYNQLYTTWQSNVTVEDKGTEVVVKIESVEGVLPAEQAFKSDKPASIEVGGVGTIIFDQTATATILDNAKDAGSTKIFFKIEDVTVSKPVENANLVYEVTMKTVDEKGDEVFSEEKARGVATVQVPLGDNVESVQSVSLVDESGNLIPGGVVTESVDFKDGILTFQVNHFSKYAIQYTEKGGPTNYVAQIGDVKYATLAEAIAAVPANTKTTITMIGNDYYEVNNPITIGKDLNVVLDLNGKTVSAVAPSGYGSAIITNNGTLTINDSGSNGKLLMLATSPDGREIPGYASNTVTNNGKLVVNGGIIENETTASDGQACYPIDNITNGNLYSPTVEINGGRFITKSNAALRLFCNSTTNMNTATINGGYFESVYFALQIRSANDGANKGTVKITGGEFEATADSYNCSVASRTGNNEAISLTIEGGKFNDNIVSKAANNTISGGLFKYKEYSYPGDANPYKLSDYVADGYAVVANTDEQTETEYPWTIGERPNVAKIGNTEYQTLSAALNAAKEGEAVYIIPAQLEETVSASNDNNIQLILNGKILTGDITFGGNGTLIVRAKELNTDYYHWIKSDEAVAPTIPAQGYGEINGNISAGGNATVMLRENLYSGSFDGKVELRGGFYKGTDINVIKGKTPNGCGIVNEDNATVAGYSYYVPEVPEAYMTHISSNDIPYSLLPDYAEGKEYAVEEINKLTLGYGLQIENIIQPFWLKYPDLNKVDVDKIFPDDVYAFFANLKDAESVYKLWTCNFVISYSKPITQDHESGIWGYYGGKCFGCLLSQELTMSDFDLPFDKTYSNMVEQVGMFLCGPQNLNSNNTGNVITVSLNIYDPNDKTKFITTNKVVYVIPQIQ